MKKIIAALAASAALLSPALALASVNITLSGGTVTVQAGQSYNEPGYSAFSSVDGDITSSVSVSNPGTSQPGTYTIDYSVTDSALSSAFGSRTLIITGAGGGAMPFCSGPMAPGWNSSLIDGGCGSTARFVEFGKPLNAVGVLFGASKNDVCQFYNGCMVPLNKR